MESAHKSGKAGWEAPLSGGGMGALEKSDAKGVDKSWSSDGAGNVKEGGVEVEVAKDVVAGNGEDVALEGEEEDDEEEEESEMSGSSELTASEDETTWITWFCHLKGNNFFSKIDEDYIQDDFNLTGLSALVPYYDYALDMMLDVDIPIDNLSDEQQEMIETAAEVLYGLIHARFILTTRGMQRMYEKFFNVDFGRCPRVYCQGQNVLPVGLSDTPRNFSVNVYCPRCQELYYPRSSKHANLDGAYFGTTFAHLFMLAHPDLIPLKSQQAYVPRIYGFCISKESIYYHPRGNNSTSKRRTNAIETTPTRSGNAAAGDAAAVMNGQQGSSGQKDRMRRR
jgi:casein kinase II subunit beta